MRYWLNHQRQRVHAILNSRVYFIGIYAGPSPLALAPPPGVRNPVLSRDSITDVLATFVADPFMIRVDSTWHMFFEVMAWRPGLRKGEIALATSRDGVQWSYRRVVLAESFHLSYPYVFQSGSDFYMVPESASAGAVRLYRADPFPDRWVFVKSLLSGPRLLDNSIFQRDGRWWMFTETGNAHDLLRLFQTRDLAGPWIEHPRSPIVCGDPRIARPAGRVLSLPDRLIRFAQDCRPVYGASIHAFEITKLTTRDYEETECEGNPVLTGTGWGWNGSGMHHVDAHPLGDGRWVACVDGWSLRTRKAREVVRMAKDRWLQRRAQDDS